MQEPHNAAFLRAVNTSDRVGMIIKTHHILDRLLSLVVFEALAISHGLEVASFSFALKLDLAIALGRLSPDTRPLLHKLKWLRNRFAHESCRLTRATVRDIHNCLSSRQRSFLRQPFRQTQTLDALREFIAIAYIDLKVAVQAARDSKVRGTALAELARATVSRLPASILQGPGIALDKSRIEALVASHRDARAKKGRL